MSDRSSVLVSVSEVLEMDESVLEDYREGPIAVSFLKSNGYCPLAVEGVGVMAFSHLIRNVICIMLNVKE